MTKYKDTAAGSVARAFQSGHSASSDVDARASRHMSADERARQRGSLIVEQDRTHPFTLGLLAAVSGFVAGLIARGEIILSVAVLAVACVCGWCGWALRGLR